jgi:DNA-binding MarR family transcriptional regulator
MTDAADTHAPFDLSSFLPYMLNQAAEAASAGFQPAYRDRYGMLRAEWRVMFHLARSGAMTAGEIARRARIHKTKVSRAVRALEDKRFLTRSAAGHDRRVESLMLSRAGAEAFHAIAAVASAYDAALWSRFPPEDQAALRRCLAAIAALGRDAPAPGIGD